MTTPSKGQLRGGAEDVDYEIDMLMRTAAFLCGPPTGEDPIIRRAVLESWCVHLRCLIEFFHPTRRDTIRAEHYMADVGRWNRLCPVLNERERRRRQALHQLFAHIAIGRDARKSGWRENDQRIVTRRIPLFLSSLPTRRRSWFPNAANWFPL